MAVSADEQQLRERMRRIEILIDEASRAGDAATQQRTKEIVQLLMDLHGEGIERILDCVAADGDAGMAVIHSLAEDRLVSSLMLLYGLHPDDLETRVGQALEKSRPYLHSHGGNVELVAITDGVVRLKLQGSCHGCPSSAVTLRQTIEEAIHELAPDVTGIEIEEEKQEAVVGISLPGKLALPILAD